MRWSSSDLIENDECFAQIDLDRSGFEKECNKYHIVNKCSNVEITNNKSQQEILHIVTNPIYIIFMGCFLLCFSKNVIEWKQYKHTCGYLTQEDICRQDNWPHHYWNSFWIHHKIQTSDNTINTHAVKRHNQPKPDKTQNMKNPGNLTERSRYQWCVCYYRGNLLSAMKIHEILKCSFVIFMNNITPDPCPIPNLNPVLLF